MIFRNTFLETLYQFTYLQKKITIPIIVITIIIVLCDTINKLKKKKF